jgi:hypothetical protein
MVGRTCGEVFLKYGLFVDTPDEKLAYGIEFPFLMPVQSCLGDLKGVDEVEA